MEEAFSDHLRFFPAKARLPQKRDSDRDRHFHGKGRGNRMEQTYQTRTELRRARETVRTATGRFPLWAKVLSLVLVWAGVAYGCYFLADTYIKDIQSRLDAIAAHNEEQLEQLGNRLNELQLAMEQHRETAGRLQEQLLAVEEGLAAVKEEMSLAGSSLSTAAETKQALNDRIDQLGKELAELRKLIKQLEEAARVY
jgi:DNA repair exonuclease SbcCD ATPase subunit